VTAVPAHPGLAEPQASPVIHDQMFAGVDVQPSTAPATRSFDLLGTPQAMISAVPGM